MTAAPDPADAPGLPLGALIARLPPPARAAFHHETRRGRTPIAALTFGVVIPDMIETLIRKGQDA
jgi:hypothetical protein